MIFDMGLLSVILILAVIGVSMAAGKAVQSTTHFIWPHDVISIVLILVSVSDILYRLVAGIEALPWNPIMWCFVWLGYFGGFMVASRKDYVHLLNIRAMMDKAMTQEEIERNRWMRKFTKLKGAGLFMPYIVPYQIGATWYLRPQKNADLLKDWIFGIKCDVDTNGDLKATMDFVAFHPYFPMPKIRFLPVEIYDMGTPEIVRKGKRFECKKYNATVLIAPIGMATSIEVLFNHLLAHQRDILAVHKAQKEKLRAELDIPRVTADQIVKTVTSACLQSAPGVMLYTNARAMEELEKKPEEPPNLKKIRKSVFRRRDNLGGLQ